MPTVNPEKADPAPALTRGLELLALLARDGQSSLELLARKTGWPKSSLWRYLQALEAHDAVTQHSESKLWEARMALRPIDSVSSAALEAARRTLPLWAERTGCCTELYRVDPQRLVLIDRAEAEEELAPIRARIGFERDLSELDATALIYFASQSKVQLPKKLWAWHEGRRRKLGARTAEIRIAETQKSGWAHDNDFNEYGFRRFARPVLEQGQLVGVLAIVQRLTPRAEREKTTIHKILKTDPMS